MVMTTTTPENNTIPPSTTSSATEKQLKEVDVTDVDALMAQELNQLSIQERETIFEGIHGVDQVVQESEEMIVSSLEQLSKAIDNIAEKPCYDMAIHHPSPARKEYVESRRFRLMFLRCEEYDIEKAANRLVAFMEGMHEHYGKDVLGRPLYYDDLLPESQEYLKSGVYQLMQARDTAGRAVLFDYHLTAKKVYKKTENLIQTVMYLFFCALEDEMTQIRGLITIAYYVGKLKGKLNNEATRGLRKIQSWMPIKLPALHICFDDPVLRAWAPVGKVLMGSHLRQRLRIHDGSHTECVYALMTFGVPVGSLPVNYKGDLKLPNHHKWLSRRQVKEDSMKTTAGKLLDDGGVIDVPARPDVILRRGRVYQEHPGNVRMRALLEQFKEEYDGMPVGEKGQVSTKIVSIIKTTDGGRFLTQDPGGWWVEVSDKEAQRRVSKSFRTARSTSSNKQQQQQSSVAVVAAPVGVEGNKRLRIDPGMESDTSGGSTGNCCMYQDLNCMRTSLSSSSKRKDRNLLM